MKKIALVLLSGVAFALNVSAGTFELPEDKPVVSINIPKGWKPQTFENGVEGVSDDDDVYIAVEYATAGDIEEATKETIEYLVKKGVKLNPSTMKQKEGKIEGFTTATIRWDGTDKDGECRVVMNFVEVSKTKALIVTFWASPSGMKKHSDTIDSIFATIKRVK